LFSKIKTKISPDPREQKWVQEAYYLSDDDGSFVNPYGVCIMSRIPVKQFTVWSLPTLMGRNCLVAEFEFNNQKFLCATVHLESLDNSDYRKKQLEVISPLLQNSHTAILTGDFNFDSDINYTQLAQRIHLATELKKKPEEMDFYPPLKGALENNNLREYFADYHDVWPYLRPNEKGYTFDSTINNMILTFEQMRYDRILFRSTQNQWETTSIQLIGNERIDVLPQSVYMSDHFGLLVILRYNS